MVLWFGDIFIVQIVLRAALLMEFPTHLIFMDKVRFISFNCNGAMNKLPVVGDLCDRADVVFLQETWCMPYDFGVFDNVNCDFYSF